MSQHLELVALDMAGTTVDEGGLVYRVLEETVTDAVGSPVTEPVPVRRLGIHTASPQHDSDEHIFMVLGQPLGATIRRNSGSVNWVSSA